VSIDAVSNVTTPAHLYFSQRLSERVAWGIGFNSPFGLVSEWNTAPLTLSSRRAELRTYLVNPNIAFALSHRWSVAVGADYLSAEARDFSHDATVGPFPTTANLRGEGDAWGYNFAIQFKIESFALAGQYRSSMSPTISGSLTFSGVPAFLNSKATARVDLPGQTMLGAAWTGKRADVEVGGYYTQWNDFKSLDIETGNPATTTHLTENWEATWSYRLGLAFRLGQEMHHEIRVGGVLDDSPVPTTYLRPSIPDSDRTGYSVGYGYLAPRWGIDVYAMNLTFDDATATGSPADGVIPGTYTSTILLAGVTAKYRF
jgi:long-chain fatty acid transport protein